MPESLPPPEEKTAEELLLRRVRQILTFSVGLPFLNLRRFLGLRHLDELQSEVVFFLYFWLPCVVSLVIRSMYLEFSTLMGMCGPILGFL